MEYGEIKLYRSRLRLFIFAAAAAVLCSELRWFASSTKYSESTYGTFHIHNERPKYQDEESKRERKKNCVPHQNVKMSICIRVRMFGRSCKAVFVFSCGTRVRECGL